MDNSERSRLDQLLDLLAEEVADRLADRSPAPAPPDRQPAPAVEEPSPPPVPPEPEPEPAPQLEPEPPAEPSGRSHAARLMGRLALGLLILVVLINVPFNRHGMTLATAMPDSRSLIIRDGLVVKEENDERIYVYQDGKFRWISRDRKSVV